MAKYCKNCGKELNENADVCLNCGILINNKISSNNMDKKNGLPTWVIVLILIGSIFLLPIIFIIVIGITAYNIVDDTTNNIEDYIEEEITQYGTVGDSLTTDEFNITLYNTEIYQSIGTDKNNLDIPSEGKEYLVFFFEIKNISDDNEYITEYDFTGYVDGNEVEVASLYNNIEGINGLNANIPSNKKVKGYVAFEVNSSWQDFEIHYNDWFGSNNIIFNITNKDNTNIIGA